MSIVKQDYGTEGGVTSYIGMIIHSTTLDTEDKVKQIYGGDTWTKIEGMFLLGQSSSYPINSTGGEATHTLTSNEMPNHTHANKVNIQFHPQKDPNNVYGSAWAVDASTSNLNYSMTSTGGSQAHNNMPPYKSVYIWERTA